MPEPIPRPTRFFFSVDLYGLRRLERFISNPFARLSHALRQLTLPQLGRNHFTSDLFSWRRRTVRRLGSRWRLLLVAILLFTNDLHQVRHFGNHATDGERVFTLNHLVQTGEAQSLDYQPLFGRSLAGRAEPFQLDLSSLWCLLRLFFYSCAGHLYSSSTDLPRLLATSLRSRSFDSASKVALITLCGFVV